MALIFVMFSLPLSLGASEYMGCILFISYSSTFPQYPEEYLTEYKEYKAESIKLLRIHEGVF